jgi:Lon protease-like protein
MHASAPETGAPSAAALAALPLFPLHAVLFPGGQLGLKVFEARYVDLVSRCLREGIGFGVVCLTEGSEVRAAGDAPAAFERAGTLARLLDVDAELPGVLHLACVGTQRFRLGGEPQQQPDGLWVADAVALADDAPLAPPAELHASVRALAQAIGRLKSQGNQPVGTPHRFDDAGWVANRWCELLPIPLAAKQRLMELDDPLVRLRLVHEYLVGKGVVGG